MNIGSQTMTKEMKVVRAQPLREQVLENLVDAMHQGQFPPGERLTEEGVAEFLGVSRTPVREALGILAQRGIIARREGGGFVVASPGVKKIENSFELRRLLEPFAIRAVVQIITNKQIAELRQTLETLREAVDKGVAGGVVQANMELRRRLFSFTDNETLIGAIAQVSEHVQLLGSLTLHDPKVRKIVLAKHERIFKSVSTRNADAAEKAVLEYLEAARRAALDALPAPPV